MGKPKNLESTYLCMLNTFSRVLAPENLVSRDGFGRPVLLQLAHSLHPAGLNLALTHGIPTTFRDGVHIYRQPPSGQSRVYPVTQLRTDGVHCGDSIGTGPVVFKAVPVAGSSFSGFTINQYFMLLSFPTPLLACSGHLRYRTYSTGVVDVMPWV